MADIKEVVDKQIAKDEEAVAIPIYQRNGKPYLAKDGSRATFSVIASESKQYRKALDAYYKQCAESPVELSDADLNIGKIALGVTGWHGWEHGDTSLPCTPENVKALLSLGHILVQVQNGVFRTSDFFDAASVA